MRSREVLDDPLERRPVGASRPTAVAIDDAISSGSVTAASGTNQTPSGMAAMTSPATASDSRVLPVPPGPVSVSSRVRDEQVDRRGDLVPPDERGELRRQVVGRRVERPQRREVALEARRLDLVQRAPAVAGP